MVAWDDVTSDHVVSAIGEYDRLGPVLGTAYELATGQRLASGDFEGGKAGAVRVLGKLGFTVQEIRRPAG